MELKASLKIVVGIKSSELEEGCILETISLRCSREIWLNPISRGTGVGEMTIGVEGGKIELRIPETLFKKKDKNISQSTLEKTGTGAGAGLTSLLMVENKTLGLFLCRCIRSEKYASLACFTD